MNIKAKNGKANRAWINDHINDPYVKQAQRDGYRARAAYKLKEIDESFRVLKNAHVIVDLGCAPGAWCQYIQRSMRAQKNTIIVGIDLLPMEHIEGVRFVQGDFLEDEPQEKLKALLNGHLADVVLSDIAPNLSGISDVDNARMEHLLEMAVTFSRDHMKPNGIMVAKVFYGNSYNMILNLFKQTFKSVKMHKPKASRDRSSETYLIGTSLR
jgi:23S rRNA (uridine2552-2'-O)-methyltransferase